MCKKQSQYCGTQSTGKKVGIELETNVQVLGDYQPELCKFKLEKLELKSWRNNSSGFLTDSAFNPSFL